ncbi:MAG: transporter substrate-binding domain-containing protein [Humidesulfovibrio sp.]|nr:transporter substrate-binding domain-containing protein [Humidesulfovibrio sp.]
MTRRTVALCLVLAALVAALPVRAQAAEPFRLNTDGAPPHSSADGKGYEDRIVAEGFRRIGVPVRLVVLPSERALQNVVQGIDDGNYPRIDGLTANYPELVMVPESMSTFPCAAFTRDPALKHVSWGDLNGPQAAYVRGWKLVERNVPDPSKLKRARDQETLFLMLDMNRAQVVIADLYTGREIIRRRGYKGMRALLPPLADPPMYIYLNKRHAVLVPRLVEALREMKRDGTIERLTRAGLAGYGVDGGAP